MQSNIQIICSDKSILQIAESTAANEMLDIQSMYPGISGARVMISHRKDKPGKMYDVLVDLYLETDKHANDALRCSHVHHTHNVKKGIIGVFAALQFRLSTKLEYSQKRWRYHSDASLVA